MLTPQPALHSSVRNNFGECLFSSGPFPGWSAAGVAPASGGCCASSACCHELGLCPLLPREVSFRDGDAEARGRDRGSATSQAWAPVCLRASPLGVDSRSFAGRGRQCCVCSLWGWDEGSWMLALALQSVNFPSLRFMDWVGTKLDQIRKVRNLNRTAFP